MIITDVTSVLNACYKVDIFGHN